MKTFPRTTTNVEDRLNQEELTQDNIRVMMFNHLIYELENGSPEQQAVADRVKNAFIELDDAVDIYSETDALIELGKAMEQYKEICIIWPEGRE